MKKIVGIVIFVLVILIAIIVSYIAINYDNLEIEEISTVTLIQYDGLLERIPKSIDVDNETKVKEIQNIYNKLVK